MNRNSIIEMIKTYLEESDINISPGDPVVISELLLPCSNNNNSSQRLCTQEYIKVCIVFLWQSQIMLLFHPQIKCFRTALKCLF